MMPLARVTIVGQPAEDLIRLLPLLRIEPLVQAAAQPPLKLPPLKLAHDRVCLFVGLRPLPPHRGDAIVRLAVGDPACNNCDADFASVSALPAACFVLAHVLAIDPFLTADPRMFAVIRAALAIAPGGTRVVVEGETGTGKRSLVRLIHSASGADHPITRLDCAAFDHELAARKMAAMPCTARTIFLDHLAELTLDDQSGLLGLVRAHDAALAAEPTAAPVRLIAGSNRSLARMAAAGSFLPELQRLFDATLEIPPLCDRPADIAMLAQYFLRRLNCGLAFAADALRALRGCRFGGNVRELQNLVTRCALAPAPRGGNILRRSDVMNEVADLKAAHIETAFCYQRAHNSVFAKGEILHSSRHRDVIDGVLQRSRRGRDPTQTFSLLSTPPPKSATDQETATGDVLDKTPRLALSLVGRKANHLGSVPRKERPHMARKLTIGINWQGKLDFKALIERARLADQAGVHSIWVAEAWGRDAFTLLTLLAEHTSKAQLATSIVNTYSRTPAALAQHFGTLDELSNGRMIAGLGTSGPNVIEHFHGIRFNPPLTRMREYVEIFNLLMAGVPLNYNGEIFKLGRGFTLRFEPVRKHIPIFIASLNRKSVEYTARAADGWMPVMIPLSGLKSSIATFREMVSAAGRDPMIVAVKAPGWVHVTDDVARVKAAHAGTLAFYAARMGTFYSEQLTRFGFGDEVNRIKEAWTVGGAKAGTEAVAPRLLDEIGYVGDVSGAIERLKAQEKAGADLHPVEIDAGPDPRAFERTLATLIG